MSSPRSSWRPATTTTPSTALLAKKNMRVITADAPGEWPFDLKPIDGGFIVQQPDPVAIDRSAWNVVTEAQPTDSQWDDLVFAWQVCAAVSSNAIVYAKDLQAFGIGAGQQNRLDSARIAAERSAGRADGGVCASDAFFPFRDGLDAAAAAGHRGGDPARRQRARRRGDRRRQRARHRHGLHRRAPFQALIVLSDHGA